MDIATEQRRTCENCGLPSWAIGGPGVSITIHDQPENRYQKTRKRTAWCHNAECAVQALAVSKYGRASHRWPITPLNSDQRGPSRNPKLARQNGRGRPGKQKTLCGRCQQRKTARAPL